MTAPVQQGTTVKIGFGSFAYTGYVPEDGLKWKKPSGKVSEITNTDGAMLTKIHMDPRDEFSLTVVILSTGSITPPIQSATITITDPAGSSLNCGQSAAAETAFNRDATKLTLNLIKEASMTYTT